LKKFREPDRFYSTEIPEIIKISHPKNYNLGQGMIEYILVFVAVVVALVSTVGPNGLFFKKIDQSLNEATKGVKCMTDAICYDPDGCVNMCP